MKIAFCLISNRPDRALTFAQTFNHAMVKGHEYQLCLSYQEPFTKMNIDEISMAIPKGVEFVAAKRKKPEGLFNAGEARLHAFSLADADYLIMCDDDFRFTDGKTTQAGLSAGQRYLDSAKHLVKDQSCGVIQVRSFFGGSEHGREVVPMFGGFYETALGLMVRGKNRPHDIIDKRLITRGIGEDVAVCITPIVNGYYCGKTYNCPTRKEPTKKILVPSGRSTLHLSDNPNYNHEYISTKGVFSKITEHFGEFHHGKQLSKQLINLYCKQAIERGNRVMERT